MVSYGKRFSLLCLLCLLWWPLNAQVDARSFFGEDYDTAALMLDKQHGNITQLCHHAGIDSMINLNCDTIATARIVLSVVFPELLRYSRFNDFFETKAVQLAYVSGGASAANYSIGWFQMRPSFVEDMERCIEQLGNCPSVLQRAFRYPSNASEQLQRRLRVARLEQITWQQYYLVTFWWICLQQHQGDFADIHSMVRYYATVYNLGIDKKPKAIEKWLNVRAFPMGSAFKGPQYNYADIALDYLNGGF